MKNDTKIWLGIHHVGDANQVPCIGEFTARNAVLEIAHFISKNSLATRIEIKIARSREEVEQRIGKTGLATDFADELEAIFGNED